jgi:SnoaL-like domain
MARIHPRRTVASALRQRRCASFARLTGLAVTAVLLAAASPGRAEAQQRLTALDYAEIEQLVHRLHFALDYCTHGGRDFADLFVPGGRYLIDEGEGQLRVMDTREQLIRLAGGSDCAGIQTPPRAYVLHAADNLVIEPTATGARGRSYAIYPASHGHYFKEEFAGQVGLYLDEYVRTREGWRLKSRRHDVTGRSGGQPVP